MQTRSSLSGADAPVPKGKCEPKGSMRRKLYLRIAAEGVKAKSHKKAFGNHHALPGAPKRHTPGVKACKHIANTLRHGSFVAFIAMRQKVTDLSKKSPCRVKIRAGPETTGRNPRLRLCLQSSAVHVFAAPRGSSRPRSVSFLSGVMPITTLRSNGNIFAFHCTQAKLL